MINKKETIAISLAIILMALIISFVKKELILETLASSLLIALIIISTAVFSKKITAKNLDMSIEIKPWTFQRYWISRSSYFKRPVSIGLILPIVLAFLSEGKIKFLAFLEFETKALPSKVSKRYGLKRYPNVMEWDDALIGFYSLLGVLSLGIISSLLDILFFKELAKYALIYSISNFIPISSLEGTKIFFGSRNLYVLSLIILVLAGLVILI